MLAAVDVKLEEVDQSIRSSSPFSAQLNICGQKKHHLPINKDISQLL